MFRWIMLLSAFLAVAQACNAPQAAVKGTPHLPAARYQNLRLLTASTEGADTDPEVSADGANILYATTFHSDKLDLYEKKRDGGTVRQVTATPDADERFPKISPADPATIAFCSDLHGEWDIFIIRD